jgi:acetylglutamate kinase
METLHIIKIGGNILDDSKQLSVFLKDFTAINEPKILIHGGGKLATELAKTLGITQTMIDGRRITDAETLNVTVMVYAGLINKTIVAKLQAENCNAMGFCGADGDLIRSKKREYVEIDFGFVGDILDNGVDTKQFKHLLEMKYVPVISPITHDGFGNLLNTNADTMASKIAIALANSFDVILTYCFEKNGVLMAIPILNKEHYLALKTAGVISKGMIPKLDNAFDALMLGVKQVSICHAQYISTIASHIKGTQLV